jgi:Na+-transporting NADH:ubiquinone oxidoreductase subunit A
LCDLDPMALHRMTKGLDLPLAGAPTSRMQEVAVARVALLGADYLELKPTLLVQLGDRVRRGQALFEDKRNPGVRFTSPAAGVVSAIHRGERRAFVSLVIEVAADDSDAAQVKFERFTGAATEQLDGAMVRDMLAESGLWTALRTRPYGKVPAVGSEPSAIFVTAIDTRPHAPPPELVLQGRAEDFGRGVRCLEALTRGPVYVCKAQDAPIPAPESERIKVEEFSGPHPAGLPGTHIHLLAPVDHVTCVWHIGYQDVAAIGRLFATGTLDVERVVSLAGSGVAQPRLLRTRLGASLADLTRGQLQPGAQRVISGSVLDGRTAMGEEHGYLGRYSLQVSALPEGTERELFGWITPGRNKFSLCNVVLGAFLSKHGKRSLALSTTTNGSARAMVPIGSYERVMPLDILPTFLLRALITKDAERAAALGALELDEEDLALCTLVCPGKFEYGPMLRSMLARLEAEH